MTLHTYINHTLEYVIKHVDTLGNLVCVFAMNQLLPSDFQAECIPHAKVKPSKKQTVPLHPRHQ